MVIKDTVVKFQKCCYAQMGRLRGMCKTCGKHIHELDNICIMTCSEFGIEEPLHVGFHENCGVSISSSEIER